MNSNNIEELVSSHEKAINEAIRLYRKSSKTLFSVIYKAYSELPTSDYKELKDRVDVDPSTLNKIEKIISNSVVMSNLKSLPAAWSTLYQIALIEGAKLEQLITDQSIHKKITSKEVKKIRLDAENQDQPVTPRHEESEQPSQSSHPDNPKSITLNVVIKDDSTIEDIKNTLSSFFDLVKDRVDVSYDEDFDCEGVA